MKRKYTFGTNPSDESIQPGPHKPQASKAEMPHKVSIPSSFSISRGLNRGNSDPEHFGLHRENRGTLNHAPFTECAAIKSPDQSPISMALSARLIKDKYFIKCLMVRSPAPPQVQPLFAMVTSTGVTLVD